MSRIFLLESLSFCRKYVLQNLLGRGAVVDKRSFSLLWVSSQLLLLRSVFAVRPVLGGPAFCHSPGDGKLPLWLSCRETSQINCHSFKDTHSFSLQLLLGFSLFWGFCTFTGVILIVGFCLFLSSFLGFTEAVGYCLFPALKNSQLSHLQISPLPCAFSSLFSIPDRHITRLVLRVSQFFFHIFILSSLLHSVPSLWLHPGHIFCSLLCWEPCTRVLNNSVTFLIYKSSKIFKLSSFS